MPTKEDALRFFLDENLPKSLAKALRAAGHTAARAIDVGLRGQHDSAIFRRVRYHSIIVTRDQDYLKADLFPPPHSGIIVVKFPTSTPVPDIIETIMNAVNTLVGQELANKVYIIEAGQVRQHS